MSTPQPKGLTGKIAAFAGFLAAVAALEEAVTAMSTRTTTLMCSVRIPLPWCGREKPPVPPLPGEASPKRVDMSPPPPSVPGEGPAPSRPPPPPPPPPPRIKFGRLSDFFEISNIRDPTGRGGADSQAGPFNVIHSPHAILFEVKAKSTRTKPFIGMRLIFNFYGKAIDKDDFECGTAYMDITMKYDTWQAGEPGEGGIVYSGRNCEASIFSFEDARLPF